MQIHIIQHIEEENEGFIKTWAEKNSHTISRTRLYLKENFPDAKTIDLLVVMGGPMNVYEESEYPFLAEEKLYIKKIIDSGKKVLGICLGAQLLSVVLNGKVTRNQEKEIGWFPVRLTAEGMKSLIFRGFPESFPVLHWHGDTFSIPNEAFLLSGSAGCKNQVFLWKNKALGLQFHLEFLRNDLKKLLSICSNDLTEGKWTQKADEILADESTFQEANQRLSNILDAFNKL